MPKYPSETENRYLTPVRGLNEFVYCPRLFHLMYVQELFEDSLDTLKGQRAHQKRLTKSKASQKIDEKNEKVAPWPRDLVRELRLTSVSLGITGKFDVLLSADEETIPVEIKSGPAPDGTGSFNVGPWQLSGVAWNNDQIQLAAQMALLREAGYRCPHGRLYYRKTATLVDLSWTENLEQALRWVAQQTRSLASQPMPEPLSDSKKCIRCSLNQVCLPDETLHLKRQLAEPRQLYPGRDDCGVLHLITPGAKMGKKGEAVKIAVPGEKDVLIPMKDVAHICCWGPAQVTSQAVLELADRGVGITWLTGGGWLRAVTSAPVEKNVVLRRGQYRLFDHPPSCLKLARWLVGAKIWNQRVFVRRNEKEQPVKDCLDILRTSRENAAEAENLEVLRGIEGYAAKAYWRVFPALLQSRGGETPAMNGRSRRPPRDPGNTLLSYGYAMLLRDFMTALHGVGLDPMYGFYHALVPGRPALALDMMEAFRPLVVDSAMLRAVNEGVFTKKDFWHTRDFCALKPKAKKNWIKAYERRVDEMITHPVFGYRLSYRRLFTVEARLLGRFITGEITEYHPMTTR